MYERVDGALQFDGIVIALAHGVFGSISVLLGDVPSAGIGLRHPV